MSHISYAHSRPGRPKETWHPLADHLRDTAARAAQFAKAWDAEAWGHLAGLWHDLGKFTPEWQQFLSDAGAEAETESIDENDPPPGRRWRGPPHSGAGAIHARNRFGRLALSLEFAIAAHHAGLSDKTELESRLAEAREIDSARRAAETADENIQNAGAGLLLPSYLTTALASESRNRQLETFIRMLLSALTDADFLDTEAFFEFELRPTESRTELRKGWPRVSLYEPVLRDYLARLEESSPRTHVNEYRRKVLEWCRGAGEGPRGAYTLTVPTGGGKTLSSLAFALAHARRHSLERVIFALPFISVVDQTAMVFRKVFEPAFERRALIEHHSGIDPVRETRWNRLAAENWDAPLIVTTQVQLFESMFNRRTSFCRKLHNLARSVIVLDEVQSLPVGLLAPILDQLQQLVSNYQTTLLLMTATQPSLHRRQLGTAPFPGLDPKPVEIIPSEVLSELFASLKRVRVFWPDSDQPVGWSELAVELARERQVLAVVHKRADARDLWRALLAVADDRPLHLSALMCPAHRQAVLSEIRNRLVGGATCRVVSTQLIEAGVDVDFPAVFRAMAGLESLAQTAGRCNREGTLPEGRFHVFNAPTPVPRLLQDHRDIAVVMRRADPNLDLDSPSVFRSYFDRLYASHSPDARGIQPLRDALKFRETAERFRMIDDVTIPIVIPFGIEGRRAVDALRFGKPTREILRAVQRFIVGVYPQTQQMLLGEGAIELLHETIWTLKSETDYDKDLGLRIEPSVSEALFA